MSLPQHEIMSRTFAVQHNPNCPKPWLVRLPGKRHYIDLKPYVKIVCDSDDDVTGDALGFGKTFEEAADAAIADAERYKFKPRERRSMTPPKSERKETP